MEEKLAEKYERQTATRKTRKKIKQRVKLLIGNTKHEENTWKDPLRGPERPLRARKLEEGCKSQVAETGLHNTSRTHVERPFARPCKAAVGPKARGAQV